MAPNALLELCGVLVKQLVCSLILLRNDCVVEGTLLDVGPCKA